MMGGGKQDKGKISQKKSERPPLICENPTYTNDRDAKNKDKEGHRVFKSEGGDFSVSVPLLCP